MVDGHAGKFKQDRRRDRHHWPPLASLIQDNHPGYIGWEHEKNRQLIDANTHMKPRAQLRLTYAAATSTFCSVATGDTLYVTVSNAQGGGATTSTVPPSITGAYPL